MSLAEKQPSFFIGNLPIFGDLILAPMDGYSDMPFRRLARELGSCLSYTEFINAGEVFHPHPKLIQRLQFTEIERPVVFQIYDHLPERLVKAALILREKNPDVIDVNMGCSVHSISNRGAGAGLLRKPEKIGQIMHSLSQALDIPITAKIRLGWDADSQNYLEVAHAIEENGGKMLAVHARTKMQGYRGQADWTAIARIKEAVSIPVIGNGDVKTVADIERMKHETKCDGVMIGRAATVNPWLLSRLDRSDVSLNLVKETYEHHLQYLVDFYGEYGVILFRKYAVRYLAPYHYQQSLREQLLTTFSPEDFRLISQSIFMEIANR
jgi:tRNA-dihydrouridine synthase B